MNFRLAAISAVLAAATFSPVSHAQGDKIIVGQSAPLTGGNAAFGNDIRSGANAWFAAVNAKGGVNGRQIELVTIDDKNDRKTAGANAKTLLENPDLVALFGFASATLSLDAIPQAAARLGVVGQRQRVGLRRQGQRRAVADLDERRRGAPLADQDVAAADVALVFHGSVLVG